MAIQIDGNSLTISDVVRVARGGEKIELAATPHVSTNSPTIEKLALKLNPVAAASAPPPAPASPPRL